MMDELAISVVGLVPFLMHFVPALIVLVFMWIYSWVTPHDDSVKKCGSRYDFLVLSLALLFPWLAQWLILMA